MCPHTHVPQYTCLGQNNLQESLLPSAMLAQDQSWALRLGGSTWTFAPFGSPVFLFWNRLSLSCPVWPVCLCGPNKPWLCYLIALTTRIVGVHAWAMRPGWLWHLYCCLTAQACPQLLLTSHAHCLLQWSFSHGFVKDILQHDYSARTIITRTNYLYGGCLSDQRSIKYTMRHLKINK